ncbi:MAG: molecular chaperone [Lachnospiraceae bacterium]
MEKELNMLREEVIPWLLLLQKYYQGNFCKLDNSEWEEVLRALGEAIPEGMPNVKKGFDLLLQAEPSKRQDMQYDFNRLFIGPDTLLAPPYESIYRNPEKTLMQAETLRVRAKYLEAGLEISRKNVEPDDFIAFELEFLLFLLSEDSSEKRELAVRFLREHILVWYADHVKAIRENTEHPICLAMAMILEGVMEKFDAVLSMTPQS